MFWLTIPPMKWDKINNIDIYILHNKWTHCALIHIHPASGADDDDVHLSTAVTPRYCSTLCALGGVGSPLWSLLPVGATNSAHH